MTATWIVGIDGSDNATHAARWAIEQAVGRPVRVVLLRAWSVQEAVTGVIPGAGIDAHWAEAEAELQRHTAELVAELQRDGVEIEARVVEGRPAHALIEAGRDAELLVVGARGLGRFKGLVLGSVSHRCAAHSLVPTAIIGSDAPLGPARRVVVGYDGSANAQAAVRWALDFVDAERSVTILDALPLAPWLNPAEVRRRFATEVEAAEKEFADAMAELDPDGRADHSLVLADARLALAQAAQEADLLVVGARGRGRVGTIRLGSVSTWVVHNIRRPLVVIPAPTDDEP